jgi:hypothetical protein
MLNIVMAIKSDKTICGERANAYRGVVVKAEGNRRYEGPRDI